VLVPATDLVELLEGGLEGLGPDGPARRDARGVGALLRVQFPGDVVWLHALPQIEKAAQVPDALAHRPDLILGHLALPEVLEELRDLLRRDRPEVAPDAGELHGREVLADETLRGVAPDHL